MSRGGLGASIRRAAREYAKAERAREMARKRQAAALLKQAKDAERQARADAKDEAREYLASRLEEAEELSAGIRERETAIASLLASALGNDPSVDLRRDMKPFRKAGFDEGAWTRTAPERSHFEPPRPGWFARLVPGSAAKHERAVAAAEVRFGQAEATFRRSLAERDAALAAHEASEEARRLETEEHNAAVEESCRALADGEHDAVVGYIKLVIGGSLGGEADAVSAEVGYSVASRHVVVDLELPDLQAVPEEAGFRYVKSGDRIEAVPRQAAKRKALYAGLVCRVALKAVDTVFRGVPDGIVDCLTLNGMLDAVDPATGQDVRLCLLSVRLTSDTFRSLNLAQVEPEHCLRSLKALVSRAPAELLPVKPIVELDMVDPRFVETMDVLSGLDSRPNLMELTPTEFEGLITNLFAEMGLDTRQTRPSRDGGVDCVAFDPRPVFGGKVVIQAKRYRNTVGVSAVRDLFGTVQNEGASKGILVTTSGYGKAAYDFARGKPLELLDGSNLLHLLSEHGGVDARIVAPEGWNNLPVHGE